jgi:hypothetical protein
MGVMVSIDAQHPCNPTQEFRLCLMGFLRYAFRLIAELGVGRARSVRFRTIATSANGSCYSLRMEPGTSALERAFELARSGRCTSLDDIRRVMRAEGYGTHHLVGPSLARQLKELMQAATALRDRDRS